MNIVLTNWTAQLQSQKQAGDKDFATLNRLAIKQGATTCSGQYNFRQQVNARLRDPRQRGRDHIAVPSDDSTYGTANRPSTPIKAVVEGFFGDVAEQQTVQRYQILRGTSSSGRRFSEMRAHTKASLLAKDHIRQSAQKEDKFRNSQSLFKMGKFKNVTARTNTHNNKAAKSTERAPSSQQK